MKRFFTVLFLVATILLLTSCKVNYKKYHDWLYKEIPFEITENITLPLMTEDEKYTIRWRSNNSNVMNNFGVYKQPYESIEFKLFYTLVDKEGKEVYSNSLLCYALGIIEQDTRI